MNEKDTGATQLLKTDAPKILESKICGLSNEVQEKKIAEGKISEVHEKIAECALLNQVQLLEERSAAAERAADEAADKKQAAAEDAAKRAVAAAKKAAEEAAAAAANKAAEEEAAAAAAAAEHHAVCPGSTMHEDSQPESRASDRRGAGEGGLTEIVASSVPPSPRAEKVGGFKGLRRSGDSASGDSAVPIWLRAADTDALQLRCRLGSLVLCIVVLGTGHCLRSSQSLQTSEKTVPASSNDASFRGDASPLLQGHLGRPWRPKMASRASTGGAMTWTMSSMEHPLRDLRRSAPSSASLTSLGIVNPYYLLDGQWRHENFM